ncbi:MAG: NAD(P)/FAD-dependent oxidoreductase [Solirubrobacterales bacterium]|nr:NAD(P)/FAD-dependent oxidoreductase [Solirubrobacterales bacterium]
MAESVDVVVIGSGHNGLVAAAYLARAGLTVEVLERNPVAGGAVASEELTEPGFVHDTFSSWHPLFKLSAAYAELGSELAAWGLRYCETPELTTANVRGDGAVVLAHRDPRQTSEGFDSRDREAYVAEIDSFGATIPTVGQLLGVELFSGDAAKLTVKLARQLGRRRGLGFTADVLSSARGWFETRFQGGEVADLYAPWSLHTGLPPDSAGSGFQVLAIAGSLHAVGMPVVQGGAGNFVHAFERMIDEHGGRVSTGVEVERILTRGRRATGVIAGDRELHARRAVIANTTPTQLYGRLLDADAAPPEAVEQGRRFRFSPRAGAQIHVALKEPLRWRDSRLDAVPVVHLSDGLGSVSLACAQAAAGLLPAQPTIVVGQPTVVDPSRAPPGAGVMWIQLQQVPYAPTGDAAGEIDAGEGTWTPELERAFAERVLSRLEAHVENWPAARGEIAVLSPVELERRNPNLVRGDIYAGDCELGQSYLWRPLPGYGTHATPVEGLYQCGASTYPGPGLNAASGRIVALRVIARGGRLARAAQLLRVRR